MILIFCQCDMEFFEIISYISCTLDTRYAAVRGSFWEAGLENTETGSEYAKTRFFYIVIKCWRKGMTGVIGPNVQFPKLAKLYREMQKIHLVCVITVSTSCRY